METPTPKPHCAPRHSVRNRIVTFLVALKTTLLAHYKVSQLTILRRQRAGFMYFGSGLIAIYLSNTAMTPSIAQELVALLGLGLCGIGFFIAMLAYVRLVISRFVVFFTKS